MGLTVAQCLARADELSPAVDNARLETQLLLAAAMACKREQLLTWPEQELTAQQVQEFNDCFARRLAGEPIAYITGHREFWNLDLLVDKRVLIPRPETELLVELAPRLLAERPQPQPQPPHPVLLDLGTGSGAIALALQQQLPQAKVWATDSSKDALDVARLNAERLGMTEISFLQCSWCEGLGGQMFEMILSNPPYVAEGDPHLAEGDLRFEPGCALVASGDGLDAIRAISAQARKHIRNGGWLLLEHGAAQRAAVAAILAHDGYQQIRCWQDYAGLDRVSAGRIA